MKNIPNHLEIYEHFKTLFPTIAAEAEDWFPNGPFSIRLRNSNQKEFIFCYVSEDEWWMKSRKVFVDELLDSLKRKEKHHEE